MSSSLKFWFAKSLFHKRRAGIYAALAFSLDHDAKPAVEFQDMHETAKKRKSPMQYVYHHWIKQLRGKKAAGRLAIALSDTIPQSELALLASAEKTGKLGHGFRFLSVMVRKIEAMKAAILGAFKKTIIPAAMLVGLFYFIDAFFFASLEDTLPRKNWPWITKSMAAFCHEMTNVIFLLALFSGCVAAAWYVSLSRWTGPTRRIFEKTLFWGKYRDFQCVLFLVNLSFLMTSEIPPRAALDTIYANGNKYVRWHVEKMSKALNTEASNVGDAIIGTGLFNQELGDLMANYARWGDWHTQIENIAENALEVTTRNLEELGPKIQTALNLIIGLFVILTFVSGGAAILKIVTSLNSI